MEVLVRCFMAMHDPTMVKAHMDYGVGGRYRSCVFLGGGGIGGDGGEKEEVMVVRQAVDELLKYDHIKSTKHIATLIYKCR